MNAFLEEEQFESYLDNLDENRGYSEYLLIDAGLYMQQKPMVIISDKFDSIKSKRGRNSQDNNLERQEITLENDLVVLNIPSEKIFDSAEKIEIIGTYDETTFYELEDIDRDFEQFRSDENIFEYVKNVISENST